MDQPTFVNRKQKRYARRTALSTPVPAYSRGIHVLTGRRASRVSKTFIFDTWVGPVDPERPLRNSFLFLRVFVSQVFCTKFYKMAHNKPGPSYINATDKSASDIIQSWMEKSETDEDNYNNTSRIQIPETAHSEDEFFNNEDSDYYVESDHDTNSLISSDSDDDLLQQDTVQKIRGYYYGKNKFKWAKSEPTKNVRTVSHNIIKIPYIRSSTRREESFTPLEAFQLIFDENILKNNSEMDK